MRIFFLVVFCFILFVYACGSKEDPGSMNGNLTEHSNQSEGKPKVKVVKKKKPDFYDECQKKFELSNSQIDNLKKADRIRQKNIKGKDKIERQKVNRTRTEAIKKELKDPKLIKRFNQFSGMMKTVAYGMGQFL